MKEIASASAFELGKLLPFDPELLSFDPEDLPLGSEALPFDSPSAAFRLLPDKGSALPLSLTADGLDLSSESNPAFFFLGETLGASSAGAGRFAGSPTGLLRSPAVAEIQYIAACETYHQHVMVMASTWT